jgi:hypothetical protein
LTARTRSLWCVCGKRLGVKKRLVAPYVSRRDPSWLKSKCGQRQEFVVVAVADTPAGPFVGADEPILPDQGFSIDANPFIDPVDGNGYLFFATDYEHDQPAGTGLCVVPLAQNMTEPADDVRTVLRASAPWQIYEKDRNYKGRLWSEWNCVEGPAVVFHQGKYYCFYSGGAWHGTEYGVEAATAEHPLGPWCDDRALNGPSVLKGIPGKVIGPGHCSVVIGPDGHRRFMVYHAWNLAHTLRRMCIDPIVWTKDGPEVDGPSIDPRPL